MNAGVGIEMSAAEARGVLRVLGAFAEPEADPGAVAAELADELRLLAGWLELEHISVARKGDLAAKLAKTVTAARVRAHAATGRISAPALHA